MEILIIIIYLLLSTSGLIAIKYGANAVIFKVNNRIIHL